MADDIFDEFDVTLLKKKRRKKTTFDLDAYLGVEKVKDAADDNDGEGNNKISSTSKQIDGMSSIGGTDDNKLSEVGKIIEEESLIDLENFGCKKKKKKKKPKQALNNNEPTTTTEINDNATTIDSAGIRNDDNDYVVGIDGINAGNVVEDEDLDFFINKKKKKRPKRKGLEELCSEITIADDEQQADITLLSAAAAVAVSGGDKQCVANANNILHTNNNKENQTNAILPLHATADRDYTYDELLKRAFETMYEKNPDLAAGKKPKFIMRPPQVLRVGTKKTSFANFMDIAKTLHRTPKHLLDFVLAELGTNGSMDGNQQLIIKGRFQSKQIENVLRRYIKEYVTCHTCRSPDTILQKDTRLFFLQCEACGSRCSVASIKSGFQALTSKRAAMRAKAT